MEQIEARLAILEIITAALLTRCSDPRGAIEQTVRNAERRAAEATAAGRTELAHWLSVHGASYATALAQFPRPGQPVN
jgi:predicted nucleic acid-binding Zn ribbon protein